MGRYAATSSTAVAAANATTTTQSHVSQLRPPKRDQLDRLRAENAALLERARASEWYQEPQPFLGANVPQRSAVPAFQSTAAVLQRAARIGAPWYYNKYSNNKSSSSSSSSNNNNNNNKNREHVKRQQQEKRGVSTGGGSGKRRPLTTATAAKAEAEAETQGRNVHADFAATVSALDGISAIVRDFYKRNRRQQDHMATRHLGRYHRRDNCISPEGELVLDVPPGLYDIEVVDADGQVVVERVRVEQGAAETVSIAR